MKISQSILALITILSASCPVRAESVDLTNGNIYVPRNEEREYDTVHIFIDRTGDTGQQNCTTEKFERPLDWGTGISVWSSSQLTVQGDVTVTVCPADWLGGKIEEER